VSASPTNAGHGKVSGLDGQITAIGSSGSTFTLTLPDAEGKRKVSVTSTSHTLYQGVSDFSALAVATFVDIDGAIQSDGSLLATRLAVEDTSAVDVVSGPVIEVIPSVGKLLMLPRLQPGKDMTAVISVGP
jgi:Domain of unknown function (DUF5666)